MRKTLARWAATGILASLLWVSPVQAENLNSLSAEAAMLSNIGNNYYMGSGAKLSREFFSGVGLEAGVFYYRVVDYLVLGDSYTVVPVSLVARGTWHIVPLLDLLGYVGVQKNFSQAPLDTTSLDIGVGAVLHLGDSFGLRADAGPAAFGVGLAYLF